MRTIKFRCWNKDTNVMHDMDISSFTNWLLYPEKYTLLQFTGLLDKLGKEIYEGDIVKEDQTDRNGNVWIHEIEQYPDRLFHFIGEGMFTPNYCEVIGNIYQDENLLKG